jgi:hypothetical protein
MAALDEIHGWTSFDEEQNLGGFVHGEEIRDGLLNAVVEQVEVLAVKTADELATSVGDDDPDVDAVYADSYVGSRLVGLLRGSGRREQKDAKGKE